MLFLGNIDPTIIGLQPSFQLQDRIFSSIKNHWPDYPVEHPDAYFLSQEFTCDEELYILPETYSIGSDGST